MNRACKAVIVAGALGLAATSALAGPVEDRKELMKSVGKAIKATVPMAKGEVPYDQAAAANAMRTINGVPDKFVKLFPAGSDNHPETEAAPKIWQDMEGFLKKAEALKTASAQAAEAAGKGLDAFRAAMFGPLVEACKQCHDAYRIKKN